MSDDDPPAEAGTMRGVFELAPATRQKLNDYVQFVASFTGFTAVIVVQIAASTALHLVLQFVGGLYAGNPADIHLIVGVLDLLQILAFGIMIAAHILFNALSVVVRTLREAARELKDDSRP